MKDKQMIFYKNFEWQYPEIIINDLVNPRNCPHCNGSAIIVGQGNLWFAECQNKRLNQSPECWANHYSTSEIKRTINLWNKYDSYDMVKTDELSDEHYRLIHGQYPD